MCADISGTWGFERSACGPIFLCTRQNGRWRCCGGSKDMPIIVTADHSRTYAYTYVPPPSDEAVQKVFEHFSRVQELNIIDATCHDAGPYLDLKLPTHPPLRLHTVRLSGIAFGEHHGGVIWGV